MGAAGIFPQSRERRERQRHLMGAMTRPAFSAAAPAADDTELVQCIVARDARAFETLMRRYNRRLFRVARAILRSDTDAEDALQEAYIAVWRNIASFRGTSRLSTWLTRIVVNEAYGRMRRASHARVVPFDEGHDMSDVDDGAPAPAAPEPGPEEAALQAEMRRLLERHIDALPEQFRTAFMLREIEELSVEEAAACLDVPEATVRSRAFRARALLRASLARDIDAATLEAFGFEGDRCDRIVAAVLARLPNC